jgi:hypothetical protein
MTDKMVNGILFIIAGLGPFLVYMCLGETGIIDKGHTEKIAAYTLLTIPLAFMMTRNVQRNNFIDAGLLIMVVGLTAGIVSDAINSAELGAQSDSMGQVIGVTGWSSMYLGIFITGIGYLRTDLFPKWLSGLLTVASLGFFAFMAVLSPEQVSNNDDLIGPLWMIVSLVIVILGIFTILRRTD